MDPRLLDSRLLDVHTFYFKLTMNHNVETMTWEPTNVNLIIWMWLKIQYFPLLIQKLNEYIKVVKIVMVQILGSLEDEKTFNKLVFMKSKLYNQLTTHLNLCVCMFTHNLYTISIFFNDVAIVTWKKVYMKCHIDG